MPYPNITPDPDFDRLKTVFARGAPDRVPFIELALDEPIMVAIQEAPFSPDSEQRCREMADLFFRLGYDYVPAATNFAFDSRTIATADTAPLTAGQRHWRVDEGRGTIETWEDFARYPWPEPSDEHYRTMEWTARSLPQGMKIIALGTGGVLEWVMWLMGYGAMSFAMADQPDLVQAMFDRVGERLLKLCEAVASYDAVGAVFFGNDMGFKTQTMISPQAMRKYVFPWQRRVVEAVHAHGKPFLLHSCGNLDLVMDDLIDYVGIDAKHSFEDVITPITEAKRRWGHRVALLGGIDMDLLARGTPEQVRARTRQVLEACMPGGGFALGSGNTVANYIPIENYFAMLEEEWRLGVYA